MIYSNFFINRDNRIGVLGIEYIGEGIYNMQALTTLTLNLR
jgi:hypothetical protein